MFVLVVDLTSVSSFDIMQACDATHTPRLRINNGTTNETHVSKKHLRYVVQN